MGDILTRLAALTSKDENGLLPCSCGASARLLSKYSSFKADTLWSVKCLACFALQQLQNRRIRPAKVELSEVSLALVAAPAKLPGVKIGKHGQQKLNSGLSMYSDAACRSRAKNYWAQKFDRADSIIGNLLHTIPNCDAIQNVWCHDEKEDGYTVTLKNYTSDENGELTSSRRRRSPLCGPPIEGRFFSERA
jgi:hypothetical protein